MYVLCWNQNISNCLLWREWKITWRGILTYKIDGGGWGVGGGGMCAGNMLALVWISQSASYCLFNMKCRHSVPAITCPFQPLVGADLCCPLWLAAIEDKGVFLSLASSVKDTTMPNVLDFQLVSLCRWVGGMDRKVKNNKQTKNQNCM